MGNSFSGTFSDPKFDDVVCPPPAEECAEEVTASRSEEEETAGEGGVEAEAGV